MDKMISTKGGIVSIILIVFLLAVNFQSAMAQESSSVDKISLSLQWHTQCQFAGYYAALDKGWYMDEGIDLTIKPGAADRNSIPLVRSGVSDFGTKWLADFLGAEAKGHSLISIAQIVQKNGLVLISKKGSNITTPSDFTGKRIGIWFFGNEAQFYTLMNKQDLPLDKMIIKPLKWSIKPFLQDTFDVINVMLYNEYLRVLDSGYSKDEINIIDFADYDLNFPGQVLFTKKSTLKNRPSLCERMVRASLKGWAWAVEHQKEAVDIVLKNDQAGVLQKERQLKQMAIMAELVNYKNRALGYHEPEQVEFVMQNLVKHNVISRYIDPAELYTNFIWEKAGGRKQD
ncbi:MAG: ABC transporter substrate-binding protein [Thermodesulfobacteriota bacterium]|nr:ABC transporter substrate-binding protein [Thermodesulfobacteriota bacterium]